MIQQRRQGYVGGERMCRRSTLIWQMTSRLLSGSRTDQQRDTRLGWFRRTLSESRRWSPDVYMLRCHSHPPNDSWLLFTRRRFVCYRCDPHQEHYLYLSCQLLIAFSLHVSLLIWHAVSSSLLIIFKQIWGDKNQFSIILESFFPPSYSSALWRGLHRPVRHDWADPCRADNHLMWA